MVEFRGVVNFNGSGEVVCFCSKAEVLRGNCTCQKRDDCPEAMISIEVIPGTRPSEQKLKEEIKKVDRALTHDFSKIKESLARFEKTIKGSKFRL